MSTLIIYQPDMLRIRMTSQIVMKISLHRRSIKIFRLLDLVLDIPKTIGGSRKKLSFWYFSGGRPEAVQWVPRIFSFNVMCIACSSSLKSMHMPSKHRQPVLIQ